MRTLKIKTREPIKILFNVSEHGNDHSIELIYKCETYLYAYMIQHHTVTLDLDDIKRWVEETYYDLSFLSPQYVPCELRAKDFQKVGG